MLPVLISFAISFSLFGLVPQYLEAQESVHSPLSIAPTPPPFVPASPLPTATPSPTLKPTPVGTPKPSSTPRPSASPVTAAQLEEWFTKYANRESINKDLLKKIGVCESNLKASAVNGIYGGMYQFSPSTWVSTRRMMNQNTDPNLRFDAEEAIKTAAVRIATLGDKAWPNCR